MPLPPNASQYKAMNSGYFNNQYNEQITTKIHIRLEEVTFLDAEC
jgi:hypothetical protein